MTPSWNFRSTTKTSAIEASPLAIIKANHPSRPSPSAITSAINTWLDNITPHVPFDEVMFFDEGKAARKVGRERTTFFSGKMLTGGEVVDASVVFWMANGNIVYDRDAMEVFIGDLWEECVYWGPQFRAFGTADEGVDGDDGSEASFGCIDTRRHDGAVASMNSSLVGCKSPAEDTQSINSATADQDTAVPSQEVFAHAAQTLASFAIHQVPPPKEILDFAKRIAAAPSLALTLPPTILPPTISTLPYSIPPTPKSSLLTLQSSLLSTPLPYPTHAPNCVPLLTLTLKHKLPAPRLTTRPPRPTAAIFQPLHRDVRTQQETAKPLWMTIISKEPDEVAAPGKMFRWEYESLRSVEGLRKGGAGRVLGRVGRIVPEGWKGRVRKVGERLRLDMKGKGAEYWEKRGEEKEGLRVVRNGKGELMVVEKEDRMPVVSRFAGLPQKPLWMG